MGDYPQIRMLSQMTLKGSVKELHGVIALQLPKDKSVDLLLTQLRVQQDNKFIPLFSDFHFQINPADSFETGPPTTDTILFKVDILDNTTISYDRWKNLIEPYGGSFRTVLNQLLEIPEETKTLRQLDLFLSYDLALAAATAYKKTQMMAVFLKELHITKLASTDFSFHREGYIEFVFGNSAPFILGFKGNNSWKPKKKISMLHNKKKFKNVLLYVGPYESTPVRIQLVESDAKTRDRIKLISNTFKFISQLTGAGASTASAVPNEYAQAAAAALALGSAAITIAGGGIELLSTFVDDDVELQAFSGVGPLADNPVEIVKNGSEGGESHQIVFKLERRLITQDIGRNVTITIRKAVFNHNTFNPGLLAIDHHHQIRATWKVGIGASVPPLTLTHRLKSGVVSGPVEQSLVIQDYPLYTAAVKTDHIPFSFSLTANEKIADFRKRIDAVKDFLTSSGKTVADAISFAYTSYNNIQTYDLQRQLEQTNHKKTELSRQVALIGNKKKKLDAEILDPNITPEKKTELTSRATTLATQIEAMNRELAQDIAWQIEDLNFALAHVKSGQVLGPLAAGYATADAQIRAAATAGVQTLDAIALQAGSATKSDIEYSRLFALDAPQQDYLIKFTHKHKHQYALEETCHFDGELPEEGSSYMWIRIKTERA